MQKYYIKQPLSSKNPPIRILISNASSKIVNSLLPLLCQGDVFGKNQPIVLVLFDFKPLIKIVESLKEDLIECCYPLLKDVTFTQDMSKAFQGVDIGILFELEKDVIGFKNNAVLFRTYGLFLNQVAPKNIKLLVVGQTANTSAFVCSSFSPTLDPQNFTCLAHHLKLAAIAKMKFKADHGQELSLKCPQQQQQNLPQSQQQQQPHCIITDNNIPTLCSLLCSDSKGDNEKVKIGFCCLQSQGNNSNKNNNNNNNDSSNNNNNHTNVNSNDSKGCNSKDGGTDCDDVCVWGSCSCPIITLATNKDNMMSLHLSAETMAGMLVVAKAITEHLKYWLTDLSSTQQIIMGVINTNKHYNVDGNLFFNFPVKKIYKNNSVLTVENLNLNKNVVETLLKCSRRMCKERDSAIVDCWRIVLPHSHL